MHNNNIFESFKQKLQRYCVYWDGAPHFMAATPSETRNAADAFVVVVSRRCFKEVVRKYPLVNKTELSELLKHTGTPGFFSVHSIEVEAGNRQSIVTSWEFEEELKSRFPSAFMFIPETVLLGTELADREVAEIQIGLSRQFLVKQPGGLGVVHSMLRSEIISTSSHFLASLGLSEHSVVKKQQFPALENHQNAVANSANDYLTLIFKLLLKMKPSWLVRFISLPSSFIRPRIWAQFGAVCAGTFLMYQLAYSGYLLGLEQYLQYKSQSYSAEIEDSLSRQKRAENDYNQLLELQAWYNGASPVAQVWVLLHGLSKKGYLLSSVSMTANTWLIRGNAESALTVLESIKQDPMILTAAFEEPVRSQQGMEQFVIKFELRQETEKNTSNQNNEQALTQ